VTIGTSRCPQERASVEASVEDRSKLERAHRSDAGRDLGVRILSQQFGEGEDGERRLSHGEGRPPKKKKFLATDAGLTERRAELQTRGRRTSKALESNLQNGIDRKACSRSWLTGRRADEDQSNRPNLREESEEHSSRPGLAK
jgi:hypothetical protein